MKRQTVLLHAVVDDVDDDGIGCGNLERSHRLQALRAVAAAAGHVRGMSDCEDAADVDGGCGDGVDVAAGDD